MCESVFVCVSAGFGLEGGGTGADYQPSYLMDSEGGYSCTGFSILSELEFELIGS